MYVEDVALENFIMRIADSRDITETEKIRKILDKYMVGGFIARQSGDILFARSFNNMIDYHLMSNFLAALSIFGEENTGKIRRILIEGLEIELNIIHKHGLLLTMIFRPNMVKDYLDLECDRALDLFYAKYQDAIDSNRNNSAIYDGFEPIMSQIIRDYLIRIGAI